jgi:uncharacterized protein
MTKQSKINATYHFLGLLFFVVPLVGMAAPALFSVFRKYPPIEERNHYRAVLNFLISVFIYYVSVFIFFPRGISFLIDLIISVISALMVAYNGVLALKGEEPSYPLCLPLLKPEYKRVSIDDLMLSQSDD